MSLHITGLKQDNENKTNVDILFCSNSELLLRKLMWKAKVVILNIRSYEKDDSSFGNNYWVIDYNWQLVNLVTKYDDIGESTKYLFESWIKLVWIWAYNGWLTKEEYTKILNDVKNSYESKMVVNIEKEKIQKETENKIYENQKLKDLQIVISKVLERINETITLVTWNVSGVMLKKLKDLEEQLKKDRMWNNYDKIAMTIDQIFNIIDEIQEEFLWNIKDKEEFIWKDTVVSNFDVFRQYNSFYKSEIIKNLSEIHKKSDKYYIFLWKDWIFLKFLKFDFIKKFWNFTSIFYWFYNFCELLIIAIIAEMTFYMFFTEKFSPNVDPKWFNILINFGLLWITIYFIKKLRKKSVPNLLLLIPFIIVIYFALYYFVKVNFAL